jgi:hypothetical protein
MPIPQSIVGCARDLGGFSVARVLPVPDETEFIPY